jgi:hypothetical protein
MNNERKNEETVNVPKDPTEAVEQGSDGADREFKVTVRKVELPVRPRGVLADG